MAVCWWRCWERVTLAKVVRVLDTIIRAWWVFRVDSFVFKIIGAGLVWHNVSAYSMVEEHGAGGEVAAVEACDSQADDVVECNAAAKVYTL